MKHPVMLYKSPGRTKHKLGTYDYITVDKCDEEALDLALADGWCMGIEAAFKKSGIKVPTKLTPPVSSMPKVPKLPERKVTPPPPPELPDAQKESKEAVAETKLEKKTPAEVIADSRDRKAGK